MKKNTLKFFLLTVLFTLLFSVIKEGPQFVYQANFSSLDLISRQIDFSGFPWIIGNPRQLLIPKIHVSAKVEYVGLDKDRNMGSPTIPSEVGWYKLGYKPGMKGNAVIAGHLDTETSAAVFSNLSALNTGDQIEIIDEYNKKFIFKVTETEHFPYNQLPLEKIFGPNSKKSLNLITCGGRFDVNSHNYSDRIVVFSELQ